jgi:hypothetical protein
MMSKQVLVFILFALPQIIFAQLQVKQSIVAASGSSSSSSLQSSWSIGEIITESFSNSSVKVVHGVNESGAVYVITSIDKNDDGYHLYPNPFSSDLVLEASKGNLEKISIEVFDVTGRAIPLEISKQENQIVVSPGDIVAGVYIFKLKDQNKIQSFKIIKK